MANMDTQTNVSRLAKISGILDLIEHSAQSRRVTPEELAEFLEPVTSRLAGQMGEAPSQPATEPATEGGGVPYTPGPRQTIAERPALTHHVEAFHMARTIPLDEAVSVLQIIAARIDAELYERKAS